MYNHILSYLGMCTLYTRIQEKTKNSRIILTPNLLQQFPIKTNKTFHFSMKKLLSKQKLIIKKLIIYY